MNLEAPALHESVMRRARIAFVFTRGRRSRVQSQDATPSELFYGFLELQRWGWNVELLEEADISQFAQSLLGRAFSKILPSPHGVSPARLLGTLRARVLDRLNSFDAVVVTNQPMGVELSALATLGLLRPPVITLVMGLLPLHDEHPAHAPTLRRVFRRTTLVAISRGEEGHLKHRLRGNDIRYVPFGVDHRFWRPCTKAASRPPYVLSVGNDQHRDFQLLIRAWRPTWPTLRIITQLPIVPQPNVEVVRGHYNRQVLSDEQVRTHVQGALFAVIPVRNTWQPSGQSAALQAMACALPLIISDTAGLWDRRAMIDGANCILPRAGSRAALSHAIEQLLASDALRVRLGTAARETVEREFTSEHMASGLAQIITRRVGSG